MPAALIVLTIGGILVFSALTNTPIKDVFAGKKNDDLNGDAAVSDSTLASAGISGSAIASLANIADPGVGTWTNSNGQIVPVASWIINILKYAQKQGWSGNVTSGYRSAADQAKVCATGVQPCAEPGTSFHQGTAFPSGAVDVTNATQLSAILLASPYASELVYAGSKDPVHFSHPHNGSY